MSEWISVEQTLPGDGEIVLACDMKQKQLAAVFSIGWQVEGKWFPRDEYEQSPTHWMPLPEPPK